MTDVVHLVEHQGIITPTINPLALEHMFNSQNYTFMISNRLEVPELWGTGHHLQILPTPNFV